MAAEPNIGAMPRLLDLLAGVGAARWGLWEADSGGPRWAWLALGGTLLIYGLIGSSPLNFLRPKKQKAG
jgi:hypothetical protein